MDAVLLITNIFSIILLTAIVYLSYRSWQSLARATPGVTASNSVRWGFYLSIATLFLLLLALIIGVSSTESKIPLMSIYTLSIILSLVSLILLIRVTAILPSELRSISLLTGSGLTFLLLIILLVSVYWTAKKPTASVVVTSHLPSHIRNHGIQHGSALGEQIAHNVASQVSNTLANEFDVVIDNAIANLTAMKGQVASLRIPGSKTPVVF